MRIAIRLRFTDEDTEEAISALIDSLSEIVATGIAEDQDVIDYDGNIIGTIEVCRNLD